MLKTALPLGFVVIYEAGGLAKLKTGIQKIAVRSG